MLRKDKFIPGFYYHIYNRTIFNYPEFQNDKNAERLSQAFLLANSTNSSLAFNYLRNTQNPSFEKAMEVAARGEKLVDIICYVIMPDHYHLLLKERKGGGISSFVHKSNISVAKYINIKNQRSGPLFESLFKSKCVLSNEYLLHLSLYIHLNPLDFLSGRNWRKHNLKNWSSAKRQLLAYPWSSLKNFLNKDCENPIISGKEIITGQFHDTADYETFLKKWSADDFFAIDSFTIE